MRARRGSAPGPRWGLHAGGCPPPVPPGPLLKKAGENLLENFSGFATDYAGPPLIGRGGLVWFAGRQGGKGWWMDRLDGGKSQRSRGGGGRAPRAQRRSGGLWPPPLRWFCGPSGPAKRRRPPAHPQRHPPPPAPAHPRRPYGGWPGAQEGRGVPAGAAAFRGRGQRPRPLNMPAAGLARLRAGGLRPPAAAPLRWVFHQRQKTQQKARPFVQPSPATSTTRKKVVAIASRCETATPRRQQPLPSRATASGRQQSLLRGYRRARSTNRAGERERAFFRGAGHTKRWQEGSRQRLHPFGKAAAHALRAAAASSAPPRAAAAGQPHPLLRDARCPRRAPVARRSLPA